MKLTALLVMLASMGWGAPKDTVYLTGRLVDPNYKPPIYDGYPNINHEIREVWNEYDSTSSENQQKTVRAIIVGTLHGKITHVYIARLNHEPVHPGDCLTVDSVGTLIRCPDFPPHLAPPTRRAPLWGHSYNDYTGKCLDCNDTTNTTESK